MDGLDLEHIDVCPDDVLCNTGITRLLSLYSMWHASDVRHLTAAHNITAPSRANRRALLDLLLNHDCDHHCVSYVVIFTTLSRVRSPQQISASRAHATTPTSQTDSETSFMDVVDESFKSSIIKEWQATLNTEKLQRRTCGPCGRSWSSADLQLVGHADFDFAILRNDALHPQTWPTSYAFDLYGRALLDPAGLEDRWNLAPINMCTECRREVIGKGRMPRLCLANWLYYGHDALPSAVCDAFAASSQFDKLLVARARASRISFRFTEHRSTNPTNRDPIDGYETHIFSQRYVKGNILVMPQNSTQLNAVLPPPASVIRDTVCAVFVGRTVPTKETIALLSPVLVRRSVVETIVHFLVQSNPYYAPDDQEF